MLGTMADAFANPVMVEALILSREGNTTVDSHYYAPDLPTIDDAAQMSRWETWVRAYTALAELLQGISFQTTSTADTPDGYQVLAYGQMLATIKRPDKTKTFERQIPLVLSWSELRLERATEIMAQIDPQYAFWSSIVGMRSDRHRYTFELINIMLQFCVYIEMRFKHALGCWRPVEYNAQVQPMLSTPGHGSFPSGHATQAYAVAYLLKRLLNLKPNPDPKHASTIDQLDRQAARIATNRVIAGVHFPVDSMAGRMLGVALGEYFVGRCGVATPTNMISRTFNASVVDNASGPTEFNPFTDEQDLDPTVPGTVYSAVQGTQIPSSTLLKQVWGAARCEWKGRFP